MFTLPNTSAPTPQPTFTQPAPVSAAGPAPAGGFGGNPFADLATAKISQTGKPKLPLGRYQVEIVRCLLIDTQAGTRAFIGEYKVLATDNPSVSVGTEGSFYKETSSKQIGYLAGWLCDVIGADKANQAQLDQVRQYLPYIAAAAVTGQPQSTPDGNVFQPNVVIGRKVNLTIAPPKAGKEYNQDIWSPVTQ